MYDIKTIFGNNNLLLNKDNFFKCLCLYNNNEISVIKNNIYKENKIDSIKKFDNLMPKIIIIEKMIESNLNYLLEKKFE